MMKISPPRTFFDLYADFAVAKTTYSGVARKCTGGWQYVVLVPGWRYQQKASYQAREEPQACVQWWMKWAKNGAGGHDFIQAVYLRARCNVWNRVTLSP
jgi:hypothetical protein